MAMSVDASTRERARTCLPERDGNATRCGWTYRIVRGAAIPVRHRSRQTGRNRTMSRPLASRSSRWALLFLAVVAAVSAIDCTHSSGSPTGPSADPPPGATTATVSITVRPNPVPFSGSPITDAPNCANYANTWFYDQVLQEFGGNKVTFTSRVDTFDGRTANNLTGLNIVLNPHDSITLHARWCSGAGIAHAAQSMFSGVDGAGNVVTVTGPVAQLTAPGR
jgi:hypothetical protein